MTVRKVAIAAVGAIECGALGYLTLVTWLLTVWFLDDAAAAQMTAGDWYVIAVTRAFTALVVASISGFAIFAVNRFVARQAGYASSRIPRLSAFVFGAIVLVAGIAGSLQFAIEKPYM